MKPPKKIGFIRTFSGVILEPSTTIEELMRLQRPPYSITILLLLFISVFTPAIAQQAKYGMTVYNVEALISLFVVTFFGVLLFLFFEAIFLQLLGFTFDLPKLLGVIAYSLCPLILAFWLIYGANYLATGSISILSFIVTGNRFTDDSFLRVVPYAVILSFLWIWVVFFYALRELCESNSLTTFLVLLCSLIPGALSLAVALLLGEAVHEQTINTFLQIFKNPISLTDFVS